MTHKYTYDYQLVRNRSGSVRESRTLLQEDGNDIRIPDAPLKTRLFWHARVVMGPLGLLSGERQAEHDFRVVRETREDGERKETYVRGGRRFQRSQIDVLYDQYKFFTVETEVIY